MQTNFHALPIIFIWKFSRFASCFWKTINQKPFQICFFSLCLCFGYVLSLCFFFLSTRNNLRKKTRIYHASITKIQRFILRIFVLGKKVSILIVFTWIAQNVVNGIKRDGFFLLLSILYFYENDATLLYSKSWYIKCVERQETFKRALKTFLLWYTKW